MSQGTKITSVRNWPHDPEQNYHPSLPIVHSTIVLRSDMAKHGDGTRRNVTNQVYQKSQSMIFFDTPHIYLELWNISGVPYGNLPRWAAVLQA